MAEGVWTIAGKGPNARHEMNVSRARSPVKGPTRSVILAGSKAEDRAAVSLSHDQGPCWRPLDLPVGGHEDGLITNTVRDRFPVPPAVGLLQIAEYLLVGPDVCDQVWPLRMSYYERLRQCRVGRQSRLMESGVWAVAGTVRGGGMESFGPG
jgi:hypothetical protein